MINNKVKITEHQVQLEIMEYLRYNHYMFWRNNTGMIKLDKRHIRFGQVGSPDLMAVKNGKFYAIEVKSPTGKLSEFQKSWLSEAEDNGARCIVAHSIEEFIAKLHEFEVVESD